MANNLTAPAAGATLATREIGSAHYTAAILTTSDGADVTPTNRLPVDIGLAALTDTQLRATPLPVSGPLTDAQLRASAFAVTVSGVATAANQTTLNTSVASLLTEATFTARHPTTGAKAASGSVPTVLNNDQDPVYDHANAVKFSVTTTAATAITPPASARYLRVHATADTFLRTDGAAAADAAGSILIKAGVPETIPCVGGTAVSAVVASGTATLYATPTKSRP